MFPSNGSLFYFFSITILSTGVLALPKRHKKRKNFAKVYKFPPPRKISRIKIYLYPYFIFFDFDFQQVKQKRKKGRKEFPRIAQINSYLFYLTTNYGKQVTGKRKERTNDSRSNSKFFNNDFNICFSVNFSLNLCKKIS